MKKYSVLLMLSLSLSLFPFGASVCRVVWTIAYLLFLSHQCFSSEYRGPQLPRHKTFTLSLSLFLFSLKQQHHLRLLLFNHASHNYKFLSNFLTFPLLFTPNAEITFTEITDGRELGFIIKKNNNKVSLCSLVWWYHREKYIHKGVAVASSLSLPLYTCRTLWFEDKPV